MWQYIPDTQYSVCEEIKTGRWVACGQKQFITVSAANFLKRSSKEIMYVEINQNQTPTYKWKLNPVSDVVILSFLSHVCWVVGSKYNV